MGLFGGFKAKFTKDSTAKTSKSGKKDEVVCLGYRVYSEFDNPPQYLQASAEPSKPLPPPLRTVTSRPKSTPSTVSTGEASAILQPSKSSSVETQIAIKSPKIKKSSKKKAPATQKVPVSTASLTASKSNSTEELSNSSSMNHAMSISNPNIAYAVTTETVKLRNGSVRDESKSDPTSMYARGKTSSFNPKSNEAQFSDNTNDRSELVIQEIRSKPPKSILKQKSYTENLNSQVVLVPSNSDTNTILTSEENIYSDKEYDRSMTLASSKKNISKGITTETVDYMSATQAVTKSKSTEVATYVHTEVSSGSSKIDASTTDNTSAYYSGGYASYSTTTRSIGSTSNHAASIFFGGDEEEPEVQEPRRDKLAVIQSEEDRRSSAEC